MFYLSIDRKASYLLHRKNFIRENNLKDELARLNQEELLGTLSNVLGRTQKHEIRGAPPMGKTKGVNPSGSMARISGAEASLIKQKHGSSGQK